MKNMKRIHSVVVKRMVDESPDTSWLGEYGNRAESDYSIDRAHSRDCHSIEANHRNVVETLERAITYLNSQTYESEHKSSCAHKFLSSAECTCGLFEQNESIQDAQNVLIEAQEELQECDCGFSGHWNNREFRYFNPNWENYKGSSDADIRKYVEQDYTRMESLNAGDWCFIGIRAQAEYSVGESRGGYLTQELTSGGLWGIESDSEESYLKSVEDEELADLAVQLKGIGFSGRAIAAAFKNIEHKRD